MKRTLLTLSIATTILYGCKTQNNQQERGHSTTENEQGKTGEIDFKNRSNAESFITVDPAFASAVSAYTLISSSDTIPGSSGFMYGGAPDGQGFMKNPDGSGYIMVTNHENAWAISRVFLDKKMNPMKGEYILNGDGGMFRLCSGTLATPEEHGFPKLTFLSTGESNDNAMTQAIDPLAPADPKNQSRIKPALGKFSGENAVPLPKNAYSGKTVILLGEDAGNGQVYMYVSGAVGDLDNGKLYALKRTNGDQIEKDMTKGNTYDVAFAEVPNAKSLTGAEIEGLNSTLKSLQFGRVEDLDYRKGGGDNSREVYFSVTGVGGQPEKTLWGRVYRLKLKENDPLSGTLEVIEDGDLNPGKDLINPDNLCVTTNYVYIQEDGDSYMPQATHNSLVWQYDIASGTKKRMIDMKNQTLAGTKYNPTNDKRPGLWEYGAMTDISDVTGEPGTFLLNVHAHTWEEGDRFANPSKASSTQPYKSGGQTLLLKGVPR
jgi:secreted PhoX family phosphatase